MSPIRSISGVCVHYLSLSMHVRVHVSSSFSMLFKCPKWWKKNSSSKFMYYHHHKKKQASKHTPNYPAFVRHLNGWCMVTCFLCFFFHFFILNCSACVHSLVHFGFVSICVGSLSFEWCPDSFSCTCEPIHIIHTENIEQILFLLLLFIFVAYFFISSIFLLLLIHVIEHIYFWSVCSACMCASTFVYKSIRIRRKHIYSALVILTCFKIKLNYDSIDDRSYLTWVPFYFQEKVWFLIESR